jgi:predicted transcriptional regulator of viral defense system
MNDVKETVTTKALKIISQHNGIIRTKDAIKEGIHPRVFYKLRYQGVIEEISRGLFRISNIQEMSEPDLVTVALRFPNAVICLISALSYYNITTQISHMVYIALKKGAETPRIDYPPVSVHRFSEESLETGIIKHKIDGIKIKIYSPEKTIADCFKFRNKIGLDIALEALKLYRANYKFDLNKLIKYAKVCRVYNIMKPYLQATI